MISILRIGHRPERDKRTSTHVALVARAFGADEFVLVGDDPRIGDALDGVTRRFGGTITSRSVKDFRGEIRRWKDRGKVVHLTMYGLPVDDVIGDLRGRDLMVVVGAEKVPADIYELSDHNVSVGNQPHSEVAALAIFLDRYFEGNELRHEFGGPMTVEPSDRGKRVVDRRPDP
ncbi:MAG: tRNA (cytidine(56)-2'-O)-methyltransferase [Thermoplasmata archaeon]|nr:tRNA (cytidine(56)-2'-O)-methyltransferase [Thermoplasmata archaeon]